MIINYSCRTARFFAIIAQACTRQKKVCVMQKSLIALALTRMCFLAIGADKD